MSQEPGECKGEHSICSEENTLEQAESHKAELPREASFKEHLGCHVVGAHSVNADCCDLNIFRTPSIKKPAKIQPQQVNAVLSHEEVETFC